MALTGSSPTADTTAASRAEAAPHAGAGAMALQLALLVTLGLVAALLQARCKLRLGIPGHSAVLWLTPLLVARFLSPLTGAASMASTSMGLGLYALDGFSLRWPLLASFGTFWLVGPVLDVFVLATARPARGDGAAAAPCGRWGLVLIPLAGLVGNFAHLGLKFATGAIGFHATALGLPRGVLESVTYLVFGLAAGLLAYALLIPVKAQQKKAA